MSLERLQGLENLKYVRYALRLFSNPLLNDLSALENLTDVEDLTIHDNIGLTNLRGLENLGPFENLYIKYNDSLSACAIESICFHLYENGSENIDFNKYGCNNAEEIVEVCNSSTCTPQSIVLTEQEQIDSLLVEYSVCPEVNVMGSLEISGADIHNLSGLINIISIDGDLIINNTSNLKNLDGLENLEFINGDLKIGEDVKGGNYSLENLLGLKNLKEVHGKLSIVNNSKITNLEGLNGLNAELLESITIRKNPILSNCHIESVCHKLDIDIESVVVEDNMTDCNSKDEIISKCLISIQESDSNKQLIIFPNPTSDLIQVQGFAPHYPIKFMIHNIYGEVIKNGNITNNSIKLEGVEKGVYIIIIESNGTFMRDILIVR